MESYQQVIEWIDNFFAHKKETKNLNTQHDKLSRIRKKNIRILAYSFETANRKLFSEIRFKKNSTIKAG